MLLAFSSAVNGVTINRYNQKIQNEDNVIGRYHVLIHKWRVESLI